MSDSDEDLVTIRMMPTDERQVVAEYVSTPAPIDVHYSMRTDPQTNQQVLIARDDSRDLTFSGQLSDKPSEYYIGVREGDILKVYVMDRYYMKPVFELNPTASDQSADETPLTHSQQVMEMSDKFGSKQTQRHLAANRQYATHMGVQDVTHIDSHTQSVATTSRQQSAVDYIPDIIPNRNRSAICVEDIYDLTDIITESEYQIMKPVKTSMFAIASDNPFIQYLMSINTSPVTDGRQLIAIYIHLIQCLLRLKAPDLKKANPLPTIDWCVKQFMFDRYLSKQWLGPVDRLGRQTKYKYLMSDKQRDQLVINGIILSLMHNKYRPLDLVELGKAFKVQPKRMQTMVHNIGCYTESKKNQLGINTKFAVFKVPLNPMKTFYK